MYLILIKIFFLLLTQEAGYSWSSAAIVTIMENSVQSAQLLQPDMKEVNLTHCEEVSNKTKSDVSGLIAYQGRIRFMKTVAGLSIRGKSTEPQIRF